MEEELRNLAAAARNASFNYNRTNGVAQFMASARLEYGLAAVECRGFGQGVHPPPNAGLGASAGGEFVDLAVDRIKGISRFHAVLGNVFSLCVARIGLQLQDNEPWHMWQLHHADAARHAETAMRYLSSAKSLGHAALSIFQRMVRPPSPQAVAQAWAPVAEQFLHRAFDELAMAEASMEQIRPAIVVQHADAWMVLHG